MGGSDELEALRQENAHLRQLAKAAADIAKQQQNALNRPATREHLDSMMRAIGLLERALTVVTQVEWNPFERCPWCLQHEPAHNADCELSTLRKDLEKVLS